MDALAQIPVHQVSLTSVQSLPVEGGATLLHATVAIWCDLSSIPDEAMPWAEHDEIPSVVVTDAYLMPDRARIALSVQPSDVLFEDVVAAAQDGLNLSPFTLVVPTTAVALATSLLQAPIAFHLVLVDALPPAQPEFAVLAVDDIAAVVELDPMVTHDALCRTVEPRLHMPLMFEEEDPDEFVDLSGGPRTMRDLYWASVASLAVGQPWALNRLIDFGMQAGVHAATGSDAQKASVGDLATAAARLLDSSCDAVQEYGLSVNLSVLPAAMAGFAEQVRDRVSVEALMLLSDGVPFDRVAAEHGIAAAVPALGVVAAVRAHLIAAVEAPSGLSVSWLLGAWLDHDFAEPTWALRPLLPQMAHHDSAVAANLLGIGPSGAGSAEAGVTLQAYLHACADVLVEFEMDGPQVRSSLAEHALLPPNHHDVSLLADALLTAAREAAVDAAEDGDDDVCVGCAARHAVLSSGWNLQRLAAAAAALLPCLADVSAVEEGLPVGDQDWVTHRTAYLGRVLDSAARAAARAV